MAVIGFQMARNVRKYTMISTVLAVLFALKILPRSPEFTVCLFRISDTGSFTITGCLLPKCNALQCL